jgi:hypothetical protein
LKNPYQSFYPPGSQFGNHLSSPGSSFGNQLSHLSPSGQLSQLPPNQSPFGSQLPRPSQLSQDRLFLSHNLHQLPQLSSAWSASYNGGVQSKSIPVPLQQQPYRNDLGHRNIVVYPPNRNGRLTTAMQGNSNWNEEFKYLR